jgi:hypothetical protein
MTASHSVTLQLKAPPSNPIGNRCGRALALVRTTKLEPGREPARGRTTE